ncbi:S8 family serine peptidase [Streptomyces sp. NPDC018833]|uniref:S8 family serine peptidase n=1 Tax=Streptomyces sp. NPDC018833 TaxID=3365053 RepID=UPI003791B153
MATEQTRPHRARVHEVLDLSAGTGSEALRGYVVEATPEQVAAIRTDARVDFVEADGVVRAPEPVLRPAPVPRPPQGDAEHTPQAALPCVPNDPYFEEFQWGLEKIDAPSGSLCTRVRSAVAVLDTGVETTHEDLAAAVAGSVNFSQSPTAQDFNGHGTHVAGIAAAVTDNGIGVAGVARGTRLWNVKILNDDMTGSFESVAKGLYWVARHAKAYNIRVANLSLTTPQSSQVMRRAVRAAIRAGVTVVAAAGNLGTTQILYPAGYPEVISVAATGQDDKLSPFSTYGKWVDIAAPGADIVSTIIDNDYSNLSGTSMAAPFVSGAAAACLTTHRCHKGNVEAQLGRDTDPIPGTGTLFRYGRLNASCYRNRHHWDIALPQFGDRCRHFTTGQQSPPGSVRRGLPADGAGPASPSR